MMRDQKLWTWHIIAGAVILVFLGLHMVTMHMEGVVKIESLNPASAASEARGGEEIRPTEWANVKARGVRTLYMLSYILLLGAALFHGLYGLNNIIREANPARWIQKGVTALLLLLGVGLFVFGTWAAIAARAVARGM
jgi:quinol-cytochrome oxidoreductase complex cytochrome b subunit